MKVANLIIFMILCLSATSSFAQDQSEQRTGIKRIDTHEIDLVNGRRYVLEHGVLTEYPDLENNKLYIKNSFDFENGLIDIQDSRDDTKLAVTPFSQIAPERIAQVRDFACKIAKQSGSGNAVYANAESTNFIRAHCVPVKNEGQE